MHYTTTHKKELLVCNFTNSFSANLGYTFLYYLKLFEERVSCIIMLKMSLTI